MAKFDTTPVLMRSAHAAPGTPCISVLASPDASVVGTTHHFAETLVVGREASPKVSCPVQDGLLSRAHLRLKFSQGRYLLQDLDSTNGSFVEGTIKTEAALAPGSVVRVGETVLMLGESFDAPVESGPLVALASVTRQLVEDLASVAASELPLLITGDTGTGKHMWAAHVHAMSERKGAFVVAPCGALAETDADALMFTHGDPARLGYFPQADGGTLLLDEVLDTPMAVQVKLGSAIDSGRFTPFAAASTVAADVRVVSTSARPLSFLQSKLKAEFHSRLCGFVLALPPLRERRFDILPLFQSFGGKALSGMLVEKLLLHTWPGNVRELRQLASRVAIAKNVEREIVAATKSAAVESDAGVDKATLDLLLTRHKGNVAEVAAETNRQRKQVYRWLKRFGLDPRHYR